MRPESAKYLFDIHQAAGRIQQYVAELDRDGYRSSAAVRDAVQWNFTVIGEAVAQLHRTDPATAERITEYRRIVDFRNQLVHGYGVVDVNITWDIIQRKLPVLVRDVDRLLG